MLCFAGYSGWMFLLTLYLEVYLKLSLEQTAVSPEWHLRSTCVDDHPHTRAVALVARSDSVSLQVNSTTYDQDLTHASP
jgi:hypothetical protein